MKDLGLFTTVLAGGISVIFGYISLYLHNYLNPLAKKFSKKEWNIWSFSVLLTIASFLGIIIWFSFYEELEDWKRELFLSSLVIFFIGATGWSLMISYIMKNKKSIYLQMLFLLLTAIGCLGILIAICYSTSDWLLITAGAILLFHHLIFDSIIWVIIHGRKKNII